MTAYAIGDIQGCYKPLRCLLEKVSFNPEKDELWAVGDLVNRGPQSLETLRFLIDLGDSFKTVLGNHDLHLLAIAYGQRQLKRGDTLEHVIAAPDCDKIVKWLRKKPLVFKEKKFVVCHAGIPHHWSVKKALKLSAEVEQALQKDIHTFLENMYGNMPDKWDDDLTGPTRLRVITNYLTRMRLCTTEGRLNLEFTGSPAQGPEGFLPWFEHRREQEKKEYHFLFGHWAALPAKSYHGRFHALDSGCIWGKKLTLMQLDTMQRHYCDC